MVNDPIVSGVVITTPLDATDSDVIKLEARHEIAAMLNLGDFKRHVATPAADMRDNGKDLYHVVCVHMCVLVCVTLPDLHHAGR